MCHAFWIPHCIFQLTSSRRGWPYEFVEWYECCNFNSHPHEEDDAVDYAEKHYNVISTHILTKRMTRRITTTFMVSDYFNSHPHEEDDSYLVLITEQEDAFQLTSSRRGWPKKTSKQRKWQLFQLTSSRRGWPLLFIAFAQSLQYFNSHPHEEDDSASRSFLDFLKYFNSHPHEEDDVRSVSDRVAF